MDLNTFQIIAREHAIGTPAHGVLFQPTIHVLGLVGESGEVSELFKKFLRDGTPIDKTNLKKELGDVLWYLCNIAADNDITLEDVASANILKLADRKAHGAQRGSGNDR